MPHSYGADFSGVGLWGPRNRESTSAPAPKPAPSTIRRTTKSQLSMSATLVKLFASLASCYRIRLADASRALLALVRGAELRKLSIELRERARQLLPARAVRGCGELTTQLGVREPQRLGAPQLLAIFFALASRPPGALFFALVHPLLDAILRVD